MSDRRRRLWVKGGPDDCATGAPRARPVRLSERTPFLPRYALDAELGNHAYDAKHDPPVARKVTLPSSEECTFCGRQFFAVVPARKQMPIDIKRHSDCGMAEPLLDDFGRQF